LKEGSRNGASLSVGALLGETGGGGFFTGDPEGYVKNYGDGHVSTWGPCWATWKGAHLPGTPPSCS